MYVFRAAIFGASFLELPSSGMSLLDRLHRKTGRMLLQFSSRCPQPCVLAELGWRPFSIELVGEHARLLQRLLALNFGLGVPFVSVKSTTFGVSTFTFLNFGLGGAASGSESPLAFLDHFGDRITL